MSRQTKRSLRRDLALGFAIWLLALWGLVAAATGYVVLKELGEELDSGLRATAERLLPLVERGDLVLPAPETHKDYLLYAMQAPSGRVLQASPELALQSLAPVQNDGFWQSQTHRGYRLSDARGAMVHVVEPMAHRREAMRETLHVLVMPMLVMLPLGLFGLFWFIRRQLAPLMALSTALASRGAQDLSPLSTAELQREFVPVEAATNALIARLKAALEAEKSFSANAAHELRTPLASLTAQTQRLIILTTEPELRARAESIERDLRRLSRIAERLLQLARAEAASVFAETPSDLIPALRLVLEDFQRKGTQISATLPERLVSPLDMDAAAVILRNLLENAILHGTAPITLTLTPEGLLTLRNAGQVVPPDKLARLSQPFERAGSRATGSGLGLAIIATMANQAGLSLQFLSPATGRADGFEVQITLMP